MSSSYKKLVELADKITHFHDREDFHVGEALVHLLDPFGDMRVTQRVPLIEAKSNYGISDIRDVVDTTAGGSVTNTIGDGVYSLTTSATANSRAVLQTAERGRYNPGYGAEAGVGLRLVTTPTGSQVYRWGYFDQNNGFFFGYDADGLFVARRKAGTDTVVRQADFNANTYDGNGIYGIKIDPFDGEIWQVDFTWYGHGTINYRVITQDSRNRQWPTTAHREGPGTLPTIEDPNLPIRVEADNGSATPSTTLSCEVAGRQFSVIGAYNPNRRVTSQHRYSATVSGTNMTPLVAFRRKSAYESVSVKVDGFEVISNEDVELLASFVDTFDSATYSTPDHSPAGETAMEVTTDPSSANGSIGLTTSLVDASGIFVSTGKTDRAGLDLDVPRFQNITLSARPIDGSSAVVTCVLRVREEW